MFVYHAENQAEQATKFPSMAVNLGEIRRSVSEIISTFGKNGLFREYTAHDISHVDDMLSTLDWMIPEITKTALTKAEWLMLVLSIYFHDMGLIVTETEFEKRDQTGFKRFCEEKLFATPSGADYRAKVMRLADDQRDRFLYEEFVRYNHARRVKAWIEGKASDELGFAEAQIAEVNRLLSGLDSDFRKDLALVCESHNLDDLDDTSKYRLAHPYGNSDEETVNLQYCAAVLRSVDLIQITRRRAPSVLYRLINPSDPISQVEWSKQNAVKRIRAKVATDREGNATTEIQSDTIEIFATFHEENGFFGLNSYIRYAADQFIATYNAIQRSKNSTIKTYSFPWKFIDDANIQVEGFVKKTFGFEIDQEKILDLLTGHTLYNDGNVVVRELAQNAIDAVRLQYSKGSKSSENFGRVSIVWNSENSELTVTDNGTGMTQDIIEKHLLKVGSSRYQDPKFKEVNPSFSPISRFGIGVLSAFMVADNVEITTVSPEEPEARHISLRSVHGKYLIRLVDKTSDPIAKSIGTHGTSFRLKFRPTAKEIDVLETVQRYVMFPRCKFTAKIDKENEQVVGYATPKEALEAYLSDPRYSRTSSRGRTKVIQESVGGYTLAYALRYSEHFKDWRLIGVPDSRRTAPRRGLRAPVATCVEGIVVEFALPGYRTGEILAVANATGNSAPKTNVARSSIESTDEQKSVIAATYNILFQAVGAEAKRLNSEEGYSLTWAVEEIPYLLAPALSGTVPYYEIMQSELAKVPMILVENHDKRSALSLNDLKGIGSFWTVESMLTRSVEQFIREARTEVTATKLLVVSQGTSSSLPTGHIVANNRNGDVIRDAISNVFEIGHIEARPADRRLDLRWDLGSGSWKSKDELRQQLYNVGSSDDYVVLQAVNERGARQNGVGNVFYTVGDITTSGLEGCFAVKANSNVYLLPHTSISNYISSIENDGNNVPANLIKQYITLDLLASVSTVLGASSERSIDRYFKQIEDVVPAKLFPDKSQLIEAVLELGDGVKLYDPLAWGQREVRD